MSYIFATVTKNRAIYLSIEWSHDCHMLRRWRRLKGGVKYVIITGRVVEANQIGPQVRKGGQVSRGHTTSIVLRH